MKSWGRIATDSSHIENAHKIYVPLSFCSILQPTPLCREHGVSNLREGILVWKEYRKNGTSSQKILHLERVDARVMSWFVVVDHQIHRVCRRAKEEKLKGRVPCRVREGPKDV